MMYIFYILFYPFVILFNKINFTNKKHYLSKEELLAEKREEFEQIFEDIDKDIEIEDDQKEPVTILQEVQKGFMIKDRLLRPSLVGVSKKIEKKDKKNEVNKENLDK